MISVNNGTSNVVYLIDRKTDLQYQSAGDNNDATTTTIRIDFSDSEIVDHISIQNFNWKSFEIYYNSNSANNITLLNAKTSTSKWTTNSETSLLLYFATLTAIDSLFFQITSTMIANEEKKVGDIYIGRRYLQFGNNPSAKDYKVKRQRKEYVHEMANGGWSQYVLDTSYFADISLDFVSASETAQMLSLYNESSEFVFVPFPTGTSWDGQLYEVNWINEYTLDQPSHNNYLDTGYKGVMKLRETPK
jgi:hypothetical protein